MSRTTQLDLTVTDQPWREVPMPGANLGLQVVPLASFGETFAILARFPTGFERTTPGGYFSAEEFVVLDGHLEIEGRRLGRGDLTCIPSHFRRTSMVAPEGCTALAWFGGPAIFRTVDELGDAAVTDGIVSVPIGEGANPQLLVTSEARWSVGEDAAVLAAGSDAIDIALTVWKHGADVRPASGDGLILHRQPVGNP